MKRGLLIAAGGLVAGAALGAFSATLALWVWAKGFERDEEWTT